MKKFTLLFLALASLSFSSAQAADDFDTSKLRISAFAVR